MPLKRSESMTACKRAKKLSLQSDLRVVAQAFLDGKMSSKTPDKIPSAVLAQVPSRSYDAAKNAFKTRSWRFIRCIVSTLQDEHEQDKRNMNKQIQLLRKRLEMCRERQQNSSSCSTASLHPPGEQRQPRRPQQTSVMPPVMPPVTSPVMPPVMSPVMSPVMPQESPSTPTASLTKLAPDYETIPTFSSTFSSIREALGTIEKPETPPSKRNLRSHPSVGRQSATSAKTVIKLGSTSPFAFSGRPAFDALNKRLNMNGVRWMVPKRI